MWDIKESSDGYRPAGDIEYYLNHVGYKEAREGEGGRKNVEYYLNHVGYKDAS